MTVSYLLYTEGFVFVDMEGIYIFLIIRFVPEL